MAFDIGILTGSQRDIEFVCIPADGDTIFITVITADRKSVVLHCHKAICALCPIRFEIVYHDCGVVWRSRLHQQRKNAFCKLLLPRLDLDPVGSASCGGQVQVIFPAVNINDAD